MLRKKLNLLEVEEIRKKSEREKRRLRRSRKKFIDQIIAENPKDLCVVTLAGEIFDLKQEIEQLKSQIEKLENNTLIF